MSSLTRRDLRDAADACEIYADRLTERVERHYEAMEEGKVDDIQETADRFRRLTEKLRRADARSDPTPEKLRELAKWFDTPNKAPGFTIAPPQPSTPGMVLRQIADGLERRPTPPESGGDDG